jgi:5-methylcytosine-specific restriction enzyme A
MTTERINSERAGWVDGKRRPCRWCGAEPKGSRRTFCSDECVHQHKLRTSPAYQARYVLARDHGICEQCGRDCVAEFQRLRALRSACRSARFGNRGADLPDWYEPKTGMEEYDRECDRIGIPKHLRFLCRRLWEMDHRVPVIEGGGDCGPDNLRTLCWACHRAATAALAKRRALARKAQG